VEERAGRRRGLLLHVREDVRVHLRSLRRCEAGVESLDT